MEFAPCPACKEGRLLPFSGSGHFDFWVCSAPGCAYVVSSCAQPVTYYKGTAKAEAKEKGGKAYIEYYF